MRWRIHQDKHIEWVAVLAQSGRDEAEIKRKHHSFRQQAGQYEETRSRIIIKLVAAAFRSFYDRLAHIHVLVELGEEEILNRPWFKTSITAEGIDACRPPSG